MKLQEKRHGPLNSTHDASLDELSEVRDESSVMSHLTKIILSRFYPLSVRQMVKVLYLQYQPIRLELFRNRLENFNLTMMAMTHSIM